MKMKLPEPVSRIIHTLQQAGYEAYAVGGCVRDSLLGREPDDWDITTSARPEEVKMLFPRTVDTGLEHGTVTVLLQKEGFEVTTYRIDGEYEDGRHPKEVTFTACLEEDLKRRDFTINAMAYNEEEGLIDRFDGMEDIRRKKIRCVGNAEERFTEDALRMMRAVRFSAQLGYEIEENTAAAIRLLAGNLRKISAERIQTELVKLVVSPHPDDLKKAYEYGMTAVILPEFDRMMETQQHNPHHCLSVGEHTLKAMQAVRADKVLRLTMLFHDCGKPDCLVRGEDGWDHFYGHPERSSELARAVLRRLKFDNDTIGKVSRLCACHDREILPEAKYMRRALNRIGEDLMPLLWEVKAADLAAQSDFQREEKERRLAERIRLYEKVKADGDCVSLKQLAVTGKDLIEAGIAPGKEIGRILNAMLDAVLEDPGKNTKEQLMAGLSDWKDRESPRPLQQDTEQQV